MASKKLVIASLIILLVTVPIASIIYAQNPIEVYQLYEYTQRVEIYVASNFSYTPQIGENVAILHPTNEFQRVYAFEAELSIIFPNNTILNVTDYSIERDHDDNEYIVFAIPSKLPPESRVVLVQKVQVAKRNMRLHISEAIAGKFEDIPEDLQRKYYCSPEFIDSPVGPFHTNIPELKELAFSLKDESGNVLKTVLNIIQWISSNIQYEAGNRPHYPEETYRNGVGDCDDQAILFVTLCRILGIPSYVQLGYVYIHGTTFKGSLSMIDGHLNYTYENIGWHGWAVVYIPKIGWVPVDLTYFVGDISDIESRIVGAAVTLSKTITVYNIISMDYIADHQQLVDTVLRFNLYISQSEKLVYERGIIEERNRNIVIIISVVLICEVALLLFSLLRYSKKKSEEEAFRFKLQ